MLVWWCLLLSWFISVCQCCSAKNHCQGQIIWKCVSLISTACLYNCIENKTVGCCCLISEKALLFIMFEKQTFCIQSSTWYNYVTGVVHFDCLRTHFGGWGVFEASFTFLKICNLSFGTLEEREDCSWSQMLLEVFNSWIILMNFKV